MLYTDFDRRAKTIVLSVKTVSEHCVSDLWYQMTLQGPRSDGIVCCKVCAVFNMNNTTLATRRRITRQYLKVSSSDGSRPAFHDRHMIFCYVSCHLSTTLQASTKMPPSTNIQALANLFEMEYWKIERFLELSRKPDVPLDVEEFTERLNRARQLGAGACNWESSGNSISSSDRVRPNEPCAEGQEPLREISVPKIAVTSPDDPEAAPQALLHDTAAGLPPLKRLVCTGHFGYVHPSRFDLRFLSHYDRSTGMDLLAPPPRQILEYSLHKCYVGGESVERREVFMKAKLSMRNLKGEQKRALKSNMELVGLGRRERRKQSLYPSRTLGTVVSASDI